MRHNMLFVLGGFVLVGMFMLSANALILDSGARTDGGECLLTALSVGQSLIDEARTKSFDQKTTAGSVPSADSLTAPGALGPDGFTESVPVPDTMTVRGFGSSQKFNDVDDYNGYRRSFTTPRFGPYTAAVAVQYASPTCPDSALPSSRSFCKVMTVTVTGGGLLGPVTLKYAFTY